MVEGPFVITIAFETRQEVEDLYRAILKARASELTEVRSHQIQATAYQDRPRAAMAGRSADTSQRRYDALNAVAEAIHEMSRPT